jgi:hypothetical protein
MKFTILLLIATSLGATAQANNSKDSIKKLINGLLINNAKSTVNTESKFKVNGCQIQQEKWLQLLVTNQTFKEEIKFAKDCDIQGTVSPSIGKSFPAVFTIRNLDKFKEVRYDMLIELKYDPKPTLTTEFKNAKLHSPDQVIEFSAKNSAIINPFDPNFIEKDLGTVIDITAPFKEKLKF